MSDWSATHRNNEADALIPDTFAHWTNVINACERLCLLGARTVVSCAIRSENDTAARFIPSINSISRKIRESDNHLTTSAQCIFGLQSLAPAVSRFRLGTHEAKELAFHPIKSATLKSFAPDQVKADLDKTVESALKLFHIDDGRELTPVDLNSTAFGYLHPFTMAHILRAVTPTDRIFKPVWWRSLFVVLWYLNRRSGSLGGYPRTVFTDSPVTAFLTSKCIDAVQTVVDVFNRRWERFTKLIELLSLLRTAEMQWRLIDDLPDSLISRDALVSGYKYKSDTLIDEILYSLEQMGWDTAVGGLFSNWQSNLSELCESRKDLFKPGEDFKGYYDLCSIAFSQAFQDSRKSIESLRNLCRVEYEKVSDLSKRVRDIYEAFGQVKASGRSELTSADLSVIRNSRNIKENNKVDEVDLLPTWICSDDIWQDTLEYFQKPENFTSIIEAERQLEKHWHSHHDAAEIAAETVNKFREYVVKILDSYEHGAKPDDTNQPDLVETLDKAASHLRELHSQLNTSINDGVRWSEFLMSRHLAFATGGALSRFDSGELAHAVRTVSRYGEGGKLETVVAALDAVCDSQRPDGTWACQQPFHWLNSGFAGYVHSVEIAWAVVSTVQSIVRNPDRFGVSIGEAERRLQRTYQAVELFFKWLSGSMASISPPPLIITSGAQDLESIPDAGNNETGAENYLRHRQDKPEMYGWCSDRTYEPGRIDSWVTANTIEFLVVYRNLLQERINSKLRADFLSYNPAELHKLADVAPTDLGGRATELGAKDTGSREKETGPGRVPIIPKLYEIARGHKTLEIIENGWLPNQPEIPNISVWSAILYGPPGTSKTHLAKAVAGELGWPIIQLSPSDFLAKGEESIEARAKEIFSALSCGSRIVYFFDEIDELILDRNIQKRQQDRRSVFSFLTPSFLTKLQDLHDAAKMKEFLFLIGTNYYERIDRAAKRTGRIDEKFLVLYPDNQSRSKIIFEFFLDKIEKQILEEARMADPPRKDLTKGSVALEREKFTRLKQFFQELQDGYHEYLSDRGHRPAGAKFVDDLAEASDLLSFTRLKDFCADVWTNSKSTAATDTSSIFAELIALEQGTSERFVPDMHLADYRDRLDAKDAREEAIQVIQLISNRKPAISPDANGTKRLQEIRSLIKAMETPIQKFPLLEEIKRRELLLEDQITDLEQIGEST